MNPTPNTVMAYVDGELDAPAQAALEAALAGDASLRSAVQRQRQLRQALAQAYDPVLDEPVPASMQAALAAWPATAPAPPAPVVVELAAERIERVEPVERIEGIERAERRRAGAAARPRQWQWLQWLQWLQWPRWPQWAAMAACLVLGALLGPWLGGFGPAPQAAAALLSRGAGGALLARGELDQRLSQGLASEPPATASVALGLSFQARDGRYCRSFTLDGAAPSAGLACHDAAGWAVQALAAVPATTGGYRQAASALPPVLLQQLDALGAGPVLDTDGERAARSRGWRH